MRWTERSAWLLIVTLAVSGAAWAITEIAPFTVVDRITGTPLHVLDAAGTIHTSGLQVMNPMTILTVNGADGIPKFAFNNNGTLVALNPDNFSATPLALSGPSAEVTVTFVVPEVDTNYRIIGTLEGDLSGPGTAWVKRRSTSGFTIGTQNVYSPLVMFCWKKVRSN